MRDTSRQPAVTVLMTVYNAIPYLQDAVDSILTQSFRDFEFIIIDDGSTDGSEIQLKQYAAQDQRINLISRANKGQVPSLNEGLTYARSDLIARMDADDVSLPHRLELQFRFMNDHPEVVCLGGAFELIDQKNRRITAIRPPTDHDELERLALAGHTPINHPTAMFRKSAADRVGGYRDQYATAEDLDLWIRLAEVGNIANLPEVLIQYRLVESSLSQAQGEKQFEAIRNICIDAWERRGITGEFEPREHWRPGPDRASQFKFSIRYGWWGFNYGQRKTAVTYAAKAISKLPWHPDGWKLLICSCFKSLPDNKPTTG